MYYLLKIKPAIPILERHEISKLINRLGYNIIGSGQMADGSECDISFKNEDEKEKTK